MAAVNAERFGIQTVSDHMPRPRSASAFVLTGDAGRYTCDGLSSRPAARPKHLGLPSETAYRSYAVSACATCDGSFYKGQRFVVVGGGNTLVEEALYLSNTAFHVVVVHRRDPFRGEKILANRPLII